MPNIMGRARTTSCHTAGSRSSAGKRWQAMVGSAIASTAASGTPVNASSLTDKVALGEAVVEAQTAARRPREC